MNQDLKTDQQPDKSAPLGIVRAVTTPECLSASIITICHGVDPSEVDALVGELSRQTAAVHRGSMARAESMLVAQAHTLDSLFAKLASLALKAPRLGVLEQYMKLALRSQSQARATLQTLAEIKAPKQLAFVQQANIANQMQVNNRSTNVQRRADDDSTDIQPTSSDCSTDVQRARAKNLNAPNELLEIENGERLDSRKTGAAGGADSAVAAVAEQYGSWDWR
jgi:hypothetical protein